jgi:hemolysin activation/secretion protein
VGERVRWSLEAFHERQHSVESTTDFFLLQPVRDYTAPVLLEAEPLDLSGGRAALSWFAGVDPNALILTGRLTAEAAGGDAVYQRLSATLSASHPLPLGLAGAVEVGAGALWGDDPVQRQLFLGGSGSLRGFDTNAFHGQSMWRARAEIASGFAGARLAVFGDAGWTGPRAEFALTDPAASVGIGVSLLDGLLRADLGHGVRRGSQWKLHLYLDGLF